MQRLPLSLPGPHAPDTALTGLCRALGTHPYAAALSALNFKPVPCAYHREDGDDLTWFVDHDVSRAHDLLTRYELPAESDKSLAATDPASPFLASMCAIECFAGLKAWQRTQTVPPFVPLGQFFRPGNSSALASYWNGRQPVKAFASDLYAAAAIAVGFLPWPVLGSHGGVPLFAFAAESASFPGLTIADIERASAPQERLTPRQLPGYATEEHPFFYALQALLNLAGFAEAQRLARKHPRVALKSRHSTASAIVSAEALREGRRDTAAFRDRLYAHLSKSA